MQRRELLRLGKKMRRCLGEGDVPALHDVVRLWAPDSVIIALPAIAAHLPSSGRGVKRSVSDFHEGFTSNDAKVREVGFLAVKHLEWRSHLERLVCSPVLEAHSRHQQLPPHRRWTAAVCEHAPNHGAQSSSYTLGHTDLLRRVGGGELLDNTGLQAVPPNLLPHILAALVGAPTNGTTADRNDCRANRANK